MDKHFFVNQHGHSAAKFRCQICGLPPSADIHDTGEGAWAERERAATVNHPAVIISTAGVRDIAEEVSGNEEKNQASVPAEQAGEAPATNLGRGLRFTEHVQGCLTCRSEFNAPCGEGGRLWNAAQVDVASPVGSLSTRTFAQILAQWREEVAPLLKESKDVEVLLLGNRLLYEAYAQGEYDFAGIVKRQK